MSAILDYLSMRGLVCCSNLTMIDRSHVAATTAAARGVEDSIIKTLGRWESLAVCEDSTKPACSSFLMLLLPPEECFVDD